MNLTNTFALQCGSAALTERMQQHLQLLGLREDLKATISVLVDIPRGYALSRLALHNKQPERLLLATGSHCAEYLHDLADYEPDIILFGENIENGLPGALMQLLHGAPAVLALPPTPLSAAERQVLRLLILNYSNETIADVTAHAPKTVKNMLTGIYAKLGLDGRSAAFHYYWGTASCLRNVPPERIARGGHVGSRKPAR